MSGDNWKTLRVPPEAYDEAKAQKEANGRTWGEQLVRPENDDDARADLNRNGEVVGMLADIQLAVETVEERTGRMERTLEDLGGNR